MDIRSTACHDSGQFSSHSWPKRPEAGGTFKDDCRSVFMIIDQHLLNELAAQAKTSPRLRMNLNFHQSLDEKCHRFLNAMEPGTVVAVHHHPTKDETLVVLRGRVAVTTYDDGGAVIERVVLCHEDGRFGMNIPKNVWHTVDCLEPAVLFECKEGPFVPHELEGVMEVKK